MGMVKLADLFKCRNGPNLPKCVAMQSLASLNKKYLSCKCWVYHLTATVTIVSRERQDVMSQWMSMWGWESQPGTILTVFIK